MGVEEEQIISHHRVSHPEGRCGELVEDGRVCAAVVILQKTTTEEWKRGRRAMSKVRGRMIRMRRGRRRPMRLGLSRMERLEEEREEGATRKRIE